MRNVILGLLLTSYLFSSCNHESKYKDEIKPYVQFLNQDHKKAKDYILELFKEKDIVILTERDHRELTQYDLILEIISDKYFIENIKNIYVEVGMRNLNPELNEFIHSTNLSKEEIENKLIYFQRKCSIHPLWDYYNFNYFIKNLYLINQKLSDKNKVNLYPTDVAINWEIADSAKYTDFVHQKVWRRDSLIADYINYKIYNNKKSKKGLVIMNFRHAFNDNFKKESGRDFRNVGHYLFQSNKDKVANVLLNTLIDSNDSDTKSTNAPIQKGKWDASIELLNKNNIGFNFKDSPFGSDHFDYWSFYEHNYKYENIYTGFVYYTQPKNFKLVKGVPNLIDSTFIKKYKKRRRIYNQAWKFNHKEYSDEHIYNSNIIKEYNYEDIGYVLEEINFWIK